MDMDNAAFGVDESVYNVSKNEVIMDYIGPQFQLPERSLSRQAPSLQALVNGLGKIWDTFCSIGRSIVDTVMEAFRPIFKLIKCAIDSFYDAGLLKRPRRKHYHVAHRAHPISYKRARIAQRKMDACEDAEWDRLFRDPRTKRLLNNWKARLGGTYAI